MKKNEIQKPMIIDWEKIRREKEEAKEKTRKEEEDRIKKIKCPSCKSTKKEHKVKRSDNGIYGPGFSSWIVDEYYVCQKCGTMFKDLNKIEKEG
jgi:transposase-like protein